MTTINITVARTELSLMASKRNFGVFVMTLIVAIFQLDCLVSHWTLGHCRNLKKLLLMYQRHKYHGWHLLEV